MLTITSIQNSPSQPVERSDIFIAACGYEARATAIAQSFSRNSRLNLVFGFSSQHELEYSSNKKWFDAAGFKFFEVDDKGFRAALDECLLESRASGAIRNIEVDISCFNRLRLAHIVDALRSLSESGVMVTFRYSIAEFTPPTVDRAATVVVEPVIPEFAGWTTRPDRPPAAIVGLGYEPNKAIGVVDHLEINNATWAYYPLGPVPEYYQRVLDANRSLLEIVQLDGRCQPYDLNEPAQLFHEMNSLVSALKPHFNPVLIPFGPKLFALVALLVGTVHDDVGVWRASSGTLEAPVLRRPSGHTISFSVFFSRKR